MINQDQLTEAITWLGQQPDTLFLGQGVGCPGTRLSASFEGVPAEKKLEMPVAEALQLGISIGLSLEGFVPVSVFPRLNFLLCAMDMLVLHLDKLPVYSAYRPKVIIRTAVGNKAPLDAGPQHTGDYFEALLMMLDTVSPRRTGCFGSEDPLKVYQDAWARSGSTLVVEG